MKLACIYKWFGITLGSHDVSFTFKEAADQFYNSSLLPNILKSHSHLITCTSASFSER